jgi:hypothetical protein
MSHCCISGRPVARLQFHLLNVADFKGIAPDSIFDRDKSAKDDKHKWQAARHVRFEVPQQAILLGKRIILKNRF